MGMNWDYGSLFWFMGSHEWQTFMNLYWASSFREVHDSIALWARCQISCESPADSSASKTNLPAYTLALPIPLLAATCLTPLVQSWNSDSPPPPLPPPPQMVARQPTGPFSIIFPLIRATALAISPHPLLHFWSYDPQTSECPPPSLASSAGQSCVLVFQLTPCLLGGPHFGL